MRHINKHIKYVLIQHAICDALPLNYNELDDTIFDIIPENMSIVELVETTASLLHELEQRVHDADVARSTEGLIPLLKRPELRMLVTKSAQVIHDIMLSFDQYYIP